MTTKYNFVFLTNDQEELGRLKEIITSFDGKVTDEKKMGTKALAYPINKIESADFYEWDIEMDTTKVTEFKKKLGFQDNLIRYLLLKPNE